MKKLYRIFVGKRGEKQIKEDFTIMAKNMRAAEKQATHKIPYSKTIKKIRLIRRVK